MTLIDAPPYDPSRDIRNRNIAIASGVALVLALILAFAGYVSGHGWFFTNLNAERKVNKFFVALEAKDYAKAYGIYYNDSDWQQHPTKYDYSLARFTEDWTKYSPTKNPITTHHVDKSITDGSGAFGTGIIVAVRVDGGVKVFMYVNRADGTMTWPAPHEFSYD